MNSCVEAIVLFVLGMATGILLCTLDLHLHLRKDEL